MKIKTYTKRDIANEFSRRQNQSVRKSIDYTDTLFNILRDILIEDNPKILAALIATLIGIFSRSIIATIFSGLASYWFLIFVV